MSRILLLGVGPLPTDPGDRLFATGLRVQQIAHVLAGAGHGVTMALIGFGDTASHRPPEVRPQDPQNTGGKLLGLGEAVEVRRLDYHPEATLETLSTILFTGSYDAIVSTTDIMNDLSARMDSNHPRWMDFFGDPFAEKQMQALTHQHDGSLRVQWPLYLNALTTGDRFSVCSPSQAMAIVGQLAFAGRLNGGTDGEPLVHVLPASSRAMVEVEKRLGPQARPVSQSVPTDAFKVLWSGGYNTWADVDTLFQGLELAMARLPRLHFVSSGGAIAGHETNTSARFMELVANSPHRERYHFLGWIQTRDIPFLYRLADVAVNVDRPCYEGTFGTRNRLIDWTLFQVPIATTANCDLAQEMARLDLVSQVQTANPESLAQCLETIHNQKDYAKDRAARAKAWFEENHQEQETFRPLLNWVANPVHAGDHQRRLEADKYATAAQRATTRCIPVESRSASVLSRRHHALLNQVGRSRRGFLKRLVGKFLGS